MLPLGYQVKSCVAHSVGGIATLEAITPDEIDALADDPTAFRFGEMTLPFTGANLLLSFSQPNFYFHAAVAYASCGTWA